VVVVVVVVGYRGVVASYVGRLSFGVERELHWRQQQRQQVASVAVAVAVAVAGAVDADVGKAQEQEREYDDIEEGECVDLFVETVRKGSAPGRPGVLWLGGTRTGATH
jgi:hypothetical protein